MGFLSFCQKFITTIYHTLTFVQKEVVLISEKHMVRLTRRVEVEIRQDEMVLSHNPTQVVSAMNDHAAAHLRNARHILPGDAFVVQTLVEKFRSKGYEVEPLNMAEMVTVGTIAGEGVKINISYYRIVPKGNPGFVICFYEQISDMWSLNMVVEFFHSINSHIPPTPSVLEEIYKI